MNGLEKYNENFHDLDGKPIQPDLRIGFVLVPGFTILSLAGFTDTLRHAADESDHSQQVYCKWKILGPSMEPIPSSCGVTIHPSIGSIWWTNWIRLHCRSWRTNWTNSICFETNLWISPKSRGTQDSNGRLVCRCLCLGRRRHIDKSMMCCSPKTSQWIC